MSGYRKRVYTNAAAPGHSGPRDFPTGAWALEQMMDMLAEKIGMDPVEFRLKNFTDISQNGRQALLQRRLERLPD